MKRKVCAGILILLMAAMVPTTVLARADKTDYPVVFAHGMLGFDELVGIHYFGNDYGVFVGDPCDGFLETSCNPEIDKKQQAFAASVNPFQSSEYRGLQLADEIESYMATVGADHVNIIGHSQGGMDARKAARVLFDRTGDQVVKVLVSISAPHRGSPVGKGVLDRGPGGINALLSFVVDYFVGPLLVLEPSDFEASMKSFVYDDYDPNDGVVTGARAFNDKYGVDNTYVRHYASLITADQDNINPILKAMSLVAPTDIDGDGWCPDGDDCNNDGAAGCGDGDFEDGDDDGLVGINSQQMGYRLKYKKGWFLGTYFDEDDTTGFVDDLNCPGEVQATSYSSIIEADHLDVLGLGVIPYLVPDDFDEEQFYADLIDYIADNEGTSSGWWFW
ncbi:MAG: esterase/lipase family protein [Desulfosudaceae bacterium]